MIQTETLYSNAAIGQSPRILQDIHIKSKNIAIYQRDTTSLNQELGQLDRQSIECRAKGTLEEIYATLNTYFETKLPASTLLLEDIAHLLEMFKNVTKASSFRLLLATIDNNMCRRFHTDVNDVRLLCTYIGQGTLWLPNEAVNQKALMTRGSNEEIVKDEQLIQQVQTGDVTILKGALYPDANPILHRSPSIESSGEQRLLLRIDTNDAINF